MTNLIDSFIGFLINLLGKEVPANVKDMLEWVYNELIKLTGIAGFFGDIFGFIVMMIFTVVDFVFLFMGIVVLFASNIYVIVMVYEIFIFSKAALNTDFTSKFTIIIDDNIALLIGFYKLTEFLMIVSDKFLRYVWNAVKDLGMYLKFW